MAKKALLDIEHPTAVGGTPDSETFNEYADALEGQPAVCVVARAGVHATPERPGDDRMKVRDGEVLEVGDIVRLPLNIARQWGQSSREVAVLMARGILRPVPEDAFAKARNHEEVLAEREAERQKRRAAANQPVATHDEVAALRAELGEMKALLAAKGAAARK